MNNFFKRLATHWQKWIAGFLLLIPLLYLITLARSLVLGDPTEYTFVANQLGIAHPPGYAFMTLLGKLFQTIIPIGGIPWRMHLLSAVGATTAVLCIWGILRRLERVEATLPPLYTALVALFAALTAGTAVNVWQHAIHANPHIITATFTLANLYFLTHWWHDQQTAPHSDKWLYIFSLSTGLGVTHHPLTVFGFPAYAGFILWVWLQTTLSSRLNHHESGFSTKMLIRTTIRHQWPTLVKMVGAAIVGFMAWLYFPLRSPQAPIGPTSMNTLTGFLDHVLARGLSDSLPYFTLNDLPQRLLVFWSILRLQYSLPVIFLAFMGIFLPVIRALRRPRAYRTSHLAPILMILLTFFSFSAFVISLKAQDIMAYLLGPLLIIGLLAGVGLWQLLLLLHHRMMLDDRLLAALLAPLFLFGPVLQINRNLARGVSLTDYSEGDRYVTAVFDHFAGQGENAILLNDWEHMTPLWYTQLVEQQWPDPIDVRPEFVSAAKPWLAFVFDFLPGGPVYLSNYRREVVDAGFRLRPSGPFFKVVEPGDKTIPAELRRVNAGGEAIEIVGVSLPETAVSAGDYLPLTLAMTASITPTDYYVPIIYVGDINYTFTTDSHLPTPWWQPGEVIVERFDLPLPPDLGDGNYPVTLDLKNLSTDTLIPLNLVLGNLQITGQAHPIPTEHLLANFRQRVGLVGANAANKKAPWSEPIAVNPGATINITLEWQALAKAEESYTIFVHLIDLANRPVVDNLDYTPLGGALPTHLWIPKWLPGQQVSDPYRMEVPADLPPGDYLIEVGLYEMVSKRRLHISDQQGNLAGDRYILGPVIVEP